MSFPVHIVSIGGETATITARDDWSVSELKRAVEKSMGVCRYKLVTLDGVELESGPLCDFCSADAAPALLYLVKMPKSQEEVEWFDRWSSEAPGWFKKMGNVSMTAQEMQELYTSSCPFVRMSHRDGTYHGAKPHPTKVLPTDMASPFKPRPEPILKTSGEVLAVVKGSRAELEEFSASGHEVILQWGRCERKATLAAVSAAIIEDPLVMLGPLQNYPYRDSVVDLVIPIVAKHPKLYERLPDYLTEEREVLYAAVEADPAFKEEFLRVAGRCEIRDWKEWRRPRASPDSRCRWSKRVQ